MLSRFITTRIRRSQSLKSSGRFKCFKINQFRPSLIGSFRIHEPHSDVGLFVLLRNSGGAPQKVDFFQGIVIVMNNQITFGYRTADSATGITRATAKRLVDQLGVDETGGSWDEMCS